MVIVVGLLKYWENRVILYKMFPNVTKATSSFLWNLHDIMSRPSDPKDANKLWRVSRSLPSLMSIPLIVIVQLEDGIPHKGHPYRSIGSICLSKRDIYRFTDTFCDVLKACLNTNDARLP